MADNERTSPPPERPRAIRLTIAYEGDQLRLVSRQDVAMKVPPSDPVTGLEERAGFWVDLKDEQDQTLYRRVMHDPIRRDVEVFSQGTQRNIHRAPVAEPKGVFTVVLPEIEAAQAVALIGSPPRPPGRELSPQAASEGMPEARTAREIARFDLKPRS
jgi:hypothetical protein